MERYETALQLLPGRYWSQLREIAPEVEEYRMRVGKPLSFVRSGREYSLSDELISETDLLRTLEKATGASLHTAAPAMARGYLCVRGVRIGLCGEMQWIDGAPKGFHSYSSLALRVPHECRGICDETMRTLYANGFLNTLILSPPGGGKTTALREMIRCISDRGTRISVCDERGELAASEGTIPGFDLGRHTDVLSACPKAEAAMMLLRGMNPQIIALDEITRREDLAAVQEVVGCGVGLLATAHAASIKDLDSRPLYRKLLALGAFQAALVISIHGDSREYSWSLLS